MEANPVILAINIGDARVDGCVLEVGKGASGEITSVRELECFGENNGERNWLSIATKRIRERLVGTPRPRRMAGGALDPPHNVVQAISNFMRRGNLADSSRVIWFEPRPGNTSFSVDLPGPLVRDELRDAFDHCLLQTKANITDTVRRHNGDVLVVVPEGEQGSNEIIRAILQDHVNSLGQARVEYVHGRDIPQDPFTGSASVLGAALVTKAARGTTVPSMMENGAVFGAQVWDEVASGDQWSEVHPLYGAGVFNLNAAALTYPALNKRKYGSPKFRVVCDPFGSSKRSGEQQYLSFGHCYPIFEVPESDTKCRGRYTCTLMGYRPENGPEFLELQLDFYSTGAGPKVWTRKTYRLPLQARKGSSRLTVDLANVTTRSEFLA